MSSQPTRHLSEVDPVMRRLIQAIGPFALKPQIRCSPFEPLTRTIARGRHTLPTPRDVLRYGERGSPHRTAAAWYL